jgi:hypothetical protein
MPDKPLVWKGEALNTFGDIMRAVDAVASAEEAQEFMAVYRDVTPHAAANIGYMSGYYDRATRRRIQEWFMVAHPIFGTYEPTPEEAFELGRKLGAKAKNR